MMSIFPKPVFSFYCVTEGASTFAQTSWPNTCPEGGCQGFFTVFQDPFARLWIKEEPRLLSALR
jgi:hypothetical protein